jgi:Mg/Co/Ni transporter MgtE
MVTHERPVHDTASFLNPMILQDAWPTLTPPERLDHFRRLPWTAAEAFFLALDAHAQAELIHDLPLTERRHWLRVLAPDDVADVIQEAPADGRSSSSTRGCACDTGISPSPPSAWSGIA